MQHEETFLDRLIFHAKRDMHKAVSPQSDETVASTTPRSTGTRSSGCLLGNLTKTRVAQKMVTFSRFAYFYGLFALVTAPEGVGRSMSNCQLDDLAPP